MFKDGQAKIIQIRMLICEKQYSPSTHSVIPTRRIWNDDYDGQMIFGELGGLKFPDICLTGEEKPRKNLTQETCPDRGSNPGPLRDRQACCRLAHNCVLCLRRYVESSLSQFEDDHQHFVFEKAVYDVTAADQYHIQIQPQC